MVDGRGPATNVKHAVGGDRERADQTDPAVDWGR